MSSRDGRDDAEGLVSNAKERSEPEQTRPITDACLEAEVFANNLLMPKLMVLKQCVRLARAGIERREYPEWICKLFGVPKDKARNRLKELDLL